MTCPLNYFEVAEIHTRKTLAVIKQFKVHFVRHGIPEVVITDNGSAFANEAFAKFATEWKFEHVEPAIPTVKWESGKMLSKHVKNCSGKQRRTRKISYWQF